MASIIDKDNPYTNISALIVDDDSNIRSYIRSVLNALIVKQVTESSNGNDCIQKYKKIEPDIVFLDINMPDKDGLTVLNELRKINDQVHVVMVSGESTFDKVKTSIESGAKGFIAKPFTGKKFIDAIDKLVIKNA